MGKELYTAKQFIDAIPGTGGIIATIAKRVGCDWHTAKKYIDEYATVQQAYQDECEEVNDMVVSTILKAIRDGDVGTAKWWASRKRKAEFGDALDMKLEHSGEVGISLDEWRKQRKKQIEALDEADLNNKAT